MATVDSGATVGRAGDDGAGDDCGGDEPTITIDMHEKDAPR